MRHSKKKADSATVQQNNEDLVIVFKNFNGIFLANISNSEDKQTFAYGKDPDSALGNAINNYNRKYFPQYS